MSINTERAEQLVGEAKKVVPALALKYGGQWDNVFVPHADLFVSACQVLTREASPYISPLFAEVKEAFANFEVTAKERFAKDCIEARTNLIQSITVGHSSQQSRREDLVTRIAEIEKTLPALQKSVSRAKVAMAGHDVEIDLPPTEEDSWSKVSALIGFCIFVFVIGLDFLLTYGSMEAASNGNLAMGLTIMLVIATVFDYFVVKSMKQNTAYRDALKNFRESFPNGRNPDGFAVEDFPATEKRLAGFGFALLVALASLFIVGRIWAAFQGQNVFAVLAGSFMQVMVLCLYGWGVYKMTKPYRKHQYDALREAQEALQKSCIDLNGAKRNFDLLGHPFRVAADTAYNIYKEEIAKARESVLSWACGLNAKRLQLVGHLRGLESGLGLIGIEYRKSCTYLVHKVVEDFTLGDKQKPFESEAYRAKVLGMLNGNTDHSWREPGLTLSDFERVELVVSLPTAEETYANRREVEDEVLESLPKYDLGVSRDEVPSSPDKEAEHAAT